MKRHAIAAVVTLAVGIGLLDPYACVQYSSGGSLMSGSPAHPVPQADQDRVLDAARRALALLPEPRHYTLDRGSLMSEVEKSAPWNQARKIWSAPAAARAERAYEPIGDDAENAPPALEERVFVNSAVAMPEGLASEGGTPHAFPLRGAAAVEVTMIGAESETPTTQGGRVALPLSGKEAAAAVTVLRILIADHGAERAFRAAASSGSMRLPPSKAPARVGAVRSLVIEIYGGRRDVEEMARRVPVTELRKILDPA